MRGKNGRSGFPPDLLGAVLTTWRFLALAHPRLPSLAEERMQGLARARGDVVIEERQHKLEADQEGQRCDHDGAGRHQRVRGGGPPVIEPEAKTKKEQARARHKLERG